MNKIGTVGQEREEELGRARRWFGLREDRSTSGVPPVHMLLEQRRASPKPSCRALVLVSVSALCQVLPGGRLCSRAV